jgi:small subunit ribosomal protein S2
MAEYKVNLPTIEEMLTAGVHFGHQSKRWHPSMKKFIYTTDNKSHIIDIYKTQEQLEKAAKFLYKVASEGKQIVLVGCKRQASTVIENLAKESGALFVNQRWLGGTFTNFNSVKQNTEQLNKLQERKAKGDFSRYTKKERLLIDRKIEKLEYYVGGINGMKRYPGALVVVDVKRERTAIKEANSVGVPVVGLIDTNSDPSPVKIPVPANDDGLKSISMILKIFSDAIKEGYKEYATTIKDTVNKNINNNNVRQVERRPLPANPSVTVKQPLQAVKKEEEKVKPTAEVKKVKEKPKTEKEIKKHIAEKKVAEKAVKNKVKQAKSKIVKK